MISKSSLLSICALTAVVGLAPATQAVAAPVTGATVAAPSRSGQEINHMSLSQLGTLAPRTRLAVSEARMDPSHGYQAQRSCRRGARPGTRALKSLLHSVYSRGIPIGMHRACRGDTSEHYDGRALDWMVNSRNRVQAAEGDAFVHWLTKRTEGVKGGNARRLGVMYVIWRGRMWRAYAPGWRDYNGCSHGRGGGATACHRNHVHISLTWQGARKHTSWYRAH